MRRSLTLLLILVFVFSVPVLCQQNINLPRVSQAANVTQRIGVTDITINYSRPGVKDRVIWGALVPYNEVWRAGANENTTIEFSTEVMIDGNKVPAGKYGLHMIPAEGDWTVILNKDNAAWGSFFYKQENDQLRFKVKPQTAEFQEWLAYTFQNPQPDNVTIVMHWAKLKIPFEVKVKLNKLVLDDIQKQLTSLPGFNWQAWNQAANYAYSTTNDLDKALQWADRSIGINRNVTNIYTKAVVLDAMGKSSDANILKEETFKDGTEAQINALGYQFLTAGKVDDALVLFRKNVELHPDSWNVWDSLGEGYMNKGDKKQAKENYTKAFNMAPENQHSRIEGVLKNLE